MSINNVIGNCKKLECTFDHMVTNSQYFAAPVNSFQFILMYMPTKLPISSTDDITCYIMWIDFKQHLAAVIFTARKEVWGKVLFSEAPVILSTGGGVSPLNRDPPN